MAAAVQLKQLQLVTTLQDNKAYSPLINACIFIYTEPKVLKDKVKPVAVTKGAKASKSQKKTNLHDLLICTVII